jgi:hypothetical protein
MAQASPTLCPHNAPGQVVRADIAVPCRQCGALIKATPRAVDATRGFIPGQQEVNALYPGDGSSASAAWVFAQ